MQCSGPFSHGPSWPNVFNAPKGPPRGLGSGLSRAIALSLSGGSILLGATARRPFATSASSNAAANTPKPLSLLERFPLKAALTAGSLALVGDAIAQGNEARKRTKNPSTDAGALAQQYDFVRALRMSSYGFLLYGPLSQVWYQVLERHFPGTTLKNIALKVTANQLVLGPCVILVVFAWNFAWLGKAKELPGKYKRDMLPSLVDGWKFWIPASGVNFGLIPLQYRVAYMSTCAIFWNFYLSSKTAKT